MPPPLHLTNTALIGGELALSWSDGQETYLPLKTLRDHCPCAACQGEADALGRVLLPDQPPKTPDSYRLLRYHPVGGYALQLHWADGHNTGLHPFQQLRALGE